MWWYFEVRLLGGKLDQVVEVGAEGTMGLVLLEEEEERIELFLSLLLCEHITRRWPSASQGLGPHQELNLLASWPWTSQPPELWEVNFHDLSHPGYGALLWQATLTETDPLRLLFQSFLIVGLVVLFGETCLGREVVITSFEFHRLKGNVILGDRE